MKLSELIERLQDVQEQIGDEIDPEVTAAYQPHYPLAGEIDGVACLGEDDAPTIWIAIGNHPDRGSPYAPRAAFDEAR